MKKILVITTVASMIEQFLIPNMRLLQDMGYEVHVACNFKEGNNCDDKRISELRESFAEWNIVYYHVDFSRSISKVSDHRSAYRKISEIISSGGYEIIHCHSPIAGFLTRIAARNVRKKGCKVFYTAHGFHFYKGAPVKNWLFYYPAEKLCSYFTDVLITINREDYQLARKRMHAKQVVYVPGVGVDADKFAQTQVDRAEKRREIGIPKDAVMVLSVGELNENKNHQMVLRAMADIDDPSLHYAIAGKGPLKEKLEELACSLGIGDRFHLLGYRRDVAELNKAADLYILPSIREGLNVSLMEAMSAGLPVICSDIRGNRDLVEHDSAGFCYPTFDVAALVTRIREVLAGIRSDRFVGMDQNRMVDYNVGTITKRMLELYDLECVGTGEKVAPPVLSAHQMM